MNLHNIKSSSEPYIIINQDGIVTELNAEFTQSYGWTEQQLIDQPLLHIIPKAMRDAHNMGFSRFLQTKTPSIMGVDLKLNIIHADGKESVAVHNIIAEEIDGTWFFGATITEVK